MKERSNEEDPGNCQGSNDSMDTLKLFWMFTPLWVFIQTASVGLAALAWVAVGAFHVRLLSLILGFACGLLLGALPAIVWYRVADRLNEKYLRQPLLAIVSWSTPEQGMVGASVMLVALLFLVMQITYWNSGEVAANDSGLLFGAGIGAVTAWDIAYIRWYRKKRLS